MIGEKTCRDSLSQLTETVGECMNEEWRTIKGYPKYSVSSIGRVRNNKTLRILKPSKYGNSRHYLHVILYQGTYDSRKCIGIHRLVAEAFIPNPDNLPEVNQIDKNGFNNTVDNLEWVSHTDNIIHRNSSHQFSITDVKCIKVIRVEDRKVFNNIVEAAQECGSDSYMRIYHCLIGSRQLAFGYHWKYLEQ